METGTTSRREVNRARTREAIVAAIFDLLEETPLSSLTAEQVADAAGISRRTFFNYFPSVEAALASDSEEILDDVRAALEARDPGEPMTASATAVITEVFTVERLAQAAKVWRAIEESPAATRYALEASMANAMVLGRSWASERLAACDAGGDAMRPAVLVAALLAAFDTACRDWLARHEGPVDAAALDDFLATVRRAVGLLAPALDAG